jgi:hypothetical protein
MKNKLVPILIFSYLGHLPSLSSSRIDLQMLEGKVCTFSAISGYFEVIFHLPKFPKMFKALE